MSDEWVRRTGVRYGVQPGCTDHHLAEAAQDAHSKTYTRRKKIRKKDLPYPDTPRGSAHCGKAAWLMARRTVQTDECIYMPGSHPGFRMSVRYNFKAISASRAMCIMAHGAPPDPKAHAAHSCGNGHLSCVNPGHLRWASPKENSADTVLHHTKRAATLTRETAEEIRQQDKLPKVLAVEYGLPARVIEKIQRREIFA